MAWAEVDKASPSDMERDLALWLGKKYDDNRPKVDRMGWLSAAASATFLVEISALILDLVNR